jgi:glutamate racemase
VAIPELAGAVEFGVSDAEIESIIHDAFVDVPIRSFDILILACTHYPLVTPLFEKMLGELPLFNPAVAVAERVKLQLSTKEIGEGTTHFIISANSQTFRDRVDHLFPSGAYTLEVVE